MRYEAFSADELLAEFKAGARVISRWKPRRMFQKAKRQTYVERSNGECIEFQASALSPLVVGGKVSCEIWSGERYIYKLWDKE